MDQWSADEVIVVVKSRANEDAVTHQRIKLEARGMKLKAKDRNMTNKRRNSNL